MNGTGAYATYKLKIQAESRVQQLTGQVAQYVEGEFTTEEGSKNIFHCMCIQTIITVL